MSILFSVARASSLSSAPVSPSAFTALTAMAKTSGLIFEPYVTRSLMKMSSSACTSGSSRRASGYVDLGRAPSPPVHTGAPGIHTTTTSQTRAGDRPKKIYRGSRRRL